MADGDFSESFKNHTDPQLNGSVGEGDEGSLGLEEARLLGEATVDEVISLAEQAEELKEHDVVEEETAEAQKLKEELAKEEEENDGWVKILGNEELMKKIISKGKVNQNPLRGDICTIKVTGMLEQDESVVFQKEEIQVIQLGDAEVIPGLDLAIPLMTRGEVATIKVSQRFAYGVKGLDPLIPSLANLIFQVELVQAESEKELSELTVGERREIGNRKRNRGNFWYTRGEASLAVNCYRRALEFLDEVEGGIQFPNGNKQDITSELKELFDDRLKTLNNLAMAQLTLQSYEPALNSVEAVLKCQPDNVKALFRKGKILGEKGETEDALDTLQKAKLIEPDDKGIAAEISKLSQRRKKELQGEKQLYKRMFTDSPTKVSPTKDGKGTSSAFKSRLAIGLALSGIAIAFFAYRYHLF